MSPVSRGFSGRRRPVADSSRVPPGQYVTPDFPVLSAGPTPHTPLDEWSFTIHGAVEEPVSWPWDEFTALPPENVTVDIHCVTKWSKLDTSWKGVSVDTLLEGNPRQRPRGRTRDRRAHLGPHAEHGARGPDGQPDGHCVLQA
jgi:DMSO/TMAO reductase YedYZ molybdopterin-dependent catalytic subunit